MRVAILGGGITGLTAGYLLAKKGHSVTIFEKEKILGGLASGFNPPNSATSDVTGGWDWPLERAYHHLFANDDDILSFAKEVGFDQIYFQEPITASMYEKPNYKIQISNNKFNLYPLDTPVDFLQFPRLSPIQKIRAGAILAGLKLSPFLSLYEKQTAKEFLKKTMGNDTWNIMWESLFRKKFGKYAGNILASFIWARIKKRTKKLGYIRGGFQAFVDYLEKVNNEKGVVIKKGTGVGDIKKTGNTFVVNSQEFDSVISTLPTMLMTKITQNIFPDIYLKKFEKLHYLHAVNLIIESKEPLFEKEYWINVCSEELPIMVLVQHTNFIDKKNYNGNHILYIGNYVDKDHKLLKMGNEEILHYFLPYLKKINTKYQIFDTKYYLFKAPFAQPIFDKDFLQNKPDFKTPVKNFFIANLDMTYPYDRGTNYAVKLGREVSSLL
ncbi:hypothetical protein A3C23_04265 [Candidatus Roizmanbacteria bacterium RIFCSPHIGHO2_02_FULL_37_13b]|uniref:Amine oxidase domain-containing protein n=1 Tax=Candidatus Roizmanbacteria bacterium RIFCSPLOWO2_02_FULL_36_11 TaxID=1802071 RepID=A0A1F7JH41_9BACT|nr:MAG: hypothetical protein A3C23_04265 [Candidatus Roizmanbacteria bacterium RIFCSPHIGHO2_02_FULL_37_13b]OGK54925.1 MAG: hypothetical protein A3H78_00410 [Candidatus Roizmanbacteria bacterium RIFCSPLOWO2_02_FULL_36_11]